MGWKRVEQVPALGAHAIIGTAEIDCAHRPARDRASQGLVNPGLSCGDPRPNTTGGLNGRYSYRDFTRAS
jgi:hypothetical protein